MAQNAINFIETRLKVNRLRKFSIALGIFLFLAGVTVVGFYLYGKEAKPAIQSAKVAGTTDTAQLPKDWLLKYFGTENENDPKIGGANADIDDDILTNEQEYLFGTDPTNRDTDGDGEPDGSEVAFAQNPNGEGELQYSDEAISSYIESLGPDYGEFTEESIQKEVENFFDPDREIVMDMPQDNELVIITQNDVPAFEKYYEATKDLGVTDDAENQKIQEGIFSLPPEEINSYIAQLRAIERILKDTPVPSQIVNIQKLKVATVRAGIRMYELVRDNYRGDDSGEQFWPDFFYQTVIAQQASAMELAAWNELGQKLQDQGGL